MAKYIEAIFVKKSKTSDISGQYFNQIFLIEKNKDGTYLSVCTCGNEINVNGNSVKYGRKKSCGCLKYNHINLTGLKFNSFYVDNYSHRTKTKKHMYKVICLCGNKRIIESSRLVSGKAKSCGCKNPKIDIDSPVKKLYRISRKSKRLRTRVKLDFALSLDEFRCLIVQDCYYCGKPPSQICKTGKHLFKYNGIDRVNNELGYVQKNCVSCCKVCNMMKRDQELNYFLNKIKLIFFRFKDEIEKFD